MDDPLRVENAARQPCGYEEPRESRTGDWFGSFRTYAFAQHLRRPTFLLLCANFGNGATAESTIVDSLIGRR
jgi:hypothetical protein